MTRMVGVDVGGTFTDIFVLDEKTGLAKVAKVPTTRPDQSKGFIDGVHLQVPDLTRLSVVVHGTTVGTNALLERKGAKIGVITTEGLRDVLEMRRRDRPRTWGLRGDFEPIADRRERIGVPERTLADGTIYRAVDLDAVRMAVQTLTGRGCQAITVLFANAYANPENEIAAVAAIRAIRGNLYVSASHEILPEIREYERFSTTALNAYLQPEVSGYLNRLQGALKKDGFTGEFLVVQSNGGVMGVETACERPVRTALSGPAAGVIAAAYIATEAGFPDVITGDVGGTSFDVSLIAEGQTQLAAQASVDFGLTVRSPMIEITTIGAGGGSIAWVDKGGLLQIGPESAGSDPGPVAYGAGNNRPTVTDANVVLGRIDPDRPMGGRLDRLDTEAAARAIDRHVGTPLGLQTHAAAEAILRVANSRMAGAIRLVSVERGFDPGQFAFMPFGGGGALHACALMADVGLGRAIIPRYPGVTSAMGCVIADMRQDFVQTVNATLDDLKASGLADYAQGHLDAGLALLDAARTTFENKDAEFELDMAYAGQTHTVPVAIPVAISDGVVQMPDKHLIATAFDKTYRRIFGRLLPDGTRRVLNLRSAIIGRRPKFDLQSLAPRITGGGGAVEERPVHFAGEWQMTRVYDRLSLPVDAAVVVGPAILRQPDTTVLVEPGFAARVDLFGNTLIERIAQ